MGLGHGDERLPEDWIKPEWGERGWTTPQRYIKTYSISANQQRPFAGAFRAATVNGARRVAGQILYFAPPLIVAYVALDWAIERNEWLNSKDGRKYTEEMQAKKE